MLNSCSKKGALPDPYPTDSLGKINRWVLDSMRRFYYWSNDIPAIPDYSLSPEQFFKTLLSANDRFSHISGPNVPPGSNSYFTFGFQYTLFQVPGLDHYIGAVTFINKGGAASQAGLIRGSYFSRVNGETINAQNLTRINQLLNNSKNIQLTTAEYSNEWKELDNKSLSPDFRNENPVYYTRIFNGISKTGYLYYSSFNESYDANLLNAFSKFKNLGITDLIIDLRYNAGGSVATCAKLAAMITTRLNAGEIFAIYQGNKLLGRSSHTLQNILSTSGNQEGRQYTDLQPRQLQLNRVFILTTNATVSAAELLINNLKPFIQVIQIGEKTTGKDEASFTIMDQRTPRQVDWLLQPIVYKLFNKNNEGDYAAGLNPTYAVSETATLPLRDIGTSDDPLVRRALDIIYGKDYSEIPTDLRKGQEHSSIPVTPVYQSTIEQAVRTAPILIH
ncbi:hypothetical protein DVR12_02430 [Chitinophaga silvatica]|uniref:C-terminal processing protease CtpA/Prc, contains a PDZ domain n=2 Tax=Chitinophaga silvatica TaxID=2282649 RepID=A0A3E1YH07_9BACT|nr:hypothetical protein DVR12_02430 [Chitinophaga silvatica]